MHPRSHRTYTTPVFCVPPVCPQRVQSRGRPVLVATAGSPPDPKPSPSATFQIALISGAVAGFTVDAILFPLDTLKTRLQLAASGTARKPGALLSGLYAGFGPAVLASAPAAAAFFGVYDYLKRALSDRFSDASGRYTPFFHMLAAAGGDIASSTVRVPFEVVKQRMQSGMYTSPVAAVRNIAMKEGLTGFFAGYTSLVLRELPFDALQFPLYEFLKSALASRQKRALHTWETSVCGSIAGGVAAAVTTPLDVVKTRLMTQSASNPKYMGIIHGIRTIATEEGPTALMSGVLPRVVWISLGGAIFFGAYEAAKKAVTPVIVKPPSDKTIL